MEIRRTGIGWHAPLPVLFGQLLKERHGQCGPFDKICVFVPSSRFGRHLLAELFSADEEALHPPVVLTPNRYLRQWSEAVPELATETARLLIWRRVLTGFPRGRLGPLFPGLASASTASVPFDLAVQLLRLQDELAEMGWTIGQVAEHDAMEPERWHVLAELEAVYIDALEKAGWMDPNRTFAQMRRSIPEELEVCDRLYVVGLHNLTPRQTAIIEDFAQSGRWVEHIWGVPEDQIETLDGCGRPHPDYWESAPIPDHVIEGSVKKVAEPMAAVHAILRLASAYSESVDDLALASCEADVRETLIEMAAFEGLVFYDPEGALWEQNPLGNCLLKCLSWRKTESLKDLQDLLHHALFRAWIESWSGNPDQLQKSLYKVQKDKFFEAYSALCDGDLGASREIADIRNLVERMEQELFAGFASGFLKGLWTITHRLGAFLKSDEGGDPRLLVEELYETFGASLGGAEGEELFRHLMRTRRFYPDRDPHERPVSGWLEAPWETAPHLVLAGIPDTTVPGPKNRSPFLSPGLRKNLGLPGHREEAAFHALRLRLMLESRSVEGRLDILHYEKALSETAVLPSRFLFNSSKGGVVRRTRFLMKNESPERVTPAPSFGSQLCLPEPVAPESLSISGMNLYLKNPFHYYLRYIQKWEAFEKLPIEMDALQFGTLAHAVLERFAAEARLSPTPKSADIRAFLLAELDRTARERLGSAPAPAVQIQLDSMRQRLLALGDVFEACFQDGYMVCETEWDFGKEQPLPLGQMRLKGVIDLVLHRPSDNQYLLIDYKTRDSAQGAQAAHYKKPKTVPDDPFLPEQYFSLGDKVYRWEDLQLPLYAHAWKQIRGADVACAYINLAKAVSQIKLDVWEVTPEEVKSAVTCAEAIAGKVASGEFPFADSSWNDPYRIWFGNDYPSTIGKQWRDRHAAEVSHV